MHRVSTVVIVVLVAACSSPAAPVVTIQPTEAGPTDTIYTDAQKTKLVAENIDEVWCGEDPKPDWCKNVHRVDGAPDVLVDGTSLFVATTLADSAKARTKAAAMCSAIATSSFDENGQPIGFYHVHIQSSDPEVFLADCDVQR